MCYKCCSSGEREARSLVSFDTSPPHHLMTLLMIFATGLGQNRRDRAQVGLGPPPQARVPGRSWCHGQPPHDRTKTEPLSLPDIARCRCKPTRQVRDWPRLRASTLSQCRKRTNKASRDRPRALAELVANPRGPGWAERTPSGRGDKASNQLKILSDQSVRVLLILAA